MVSLTDQPKLSTPPQLDGDYTIQCPFAPTEHHVTLGKLLQHIEEMHCQDNSLSLIPDAMYSLETETRCRRNFFSRPRYGASIDSSSRTSRSREESDEFSTRSSSPASSSPSGSSSSSLQLPHLHHPEAMMQHLPSHYSAAATESNAGVLHSTSMALPHGQPVSPLGAVHATPELCYSTATSNWPASPYYPTAEPYAVPLLPPFSFPQRYQQWGSSAGPPLYDAVYSWPPLPVEPPHHHQQAHRLPPFSGNDTPSARPPLPFRGAVAPCASPAVAAGVTQESSWRSRCLRVSRVPSDEEGCTADEGKMDAGDDAALLDWIWEWLGGICGPDRRLREVQDILPCCAGRAMVLLKTAQLKEQILRRCGAGIPRITLDGVVFELD